MTEKKAYSVRAKELISKMTLAEKIGMVHGAHLFQAKCPVLPGDTPDDLAARIHQLEHQYFAGVIEDWVAGK